jgi:hypothetical protein
MRKSDIKSLPEFYDRYINLVDDMELLEALETITPEYLFSDTYSLQAIGDTVYAPEKWTIKDIIQHCIDTERIMSYRALRFARNDGTPLPGFEEGEYAFHTITSQRTIEDLLDEYEIVRASTVAQFQHFNDLMLNRSGVASHRTISVGSLGYVIVGHAIHHINVIRERYYPLIQQEID